MSIYSQFATDKAAELNGVNVEYGANKDGSIPSFCISRLSRTNKKYTKALNKAIEPHRRSLELGTLDESIAEQMTLEVFVDTILLGWKNIQDRKGLQIAFNRENAIKLFKELPELYDDLQEKAKKALLFREEVIEEEAKN